MDNYDVVIIGAGPAGLKCAETLSKTNFKVLLIEQNNEIGSKVCAGGLTYKALEYVDLPRRMMGSSFNKIKVHTPMSKRVLKADKKIVYMIDRKNLGEWQLKKLKKTNVTVKTNSKVTKITKNKITINRTEKIKFKYLVGADGSSSIVRRYLGLKTKNGIAIQYIIPTKKYKDLEVFFDSKLFHSWFAWIFPHKNYVSIGCGCDPNFLSSKKLIENFNKWLKENKIDISNGEYQAHPINYDYRGYKFKNIFLAGDAAGLASGFTGEGIYPALVSGDEIAKMIIDKNYVSKKIEDLLKTKKTHNIITHILERSGPFRNLQYELSALLTKNKWFAKRLLDMMT